MNLNQIGVPTTDIGKSAHFYRTLGFEPVVDLPEYARFRSVRGESTFSLLKTSGSVAADITIYFEVEDVGVTTSRLQAQGVDFVETPRVQPWGWTEARLKDPSGNLLCLFYAGHLRLNPNE